MVFFSSLIIFCDHLTCFVDLNPEKVKSLKTESFGVSRVFSVVYIRVGAIPASDPSFLNHEQIRGLYFLVFFNRSRNVRNFREKIIASNLSPKS